MKKSLVYFTALVLFMSLCICLFSCGNDNTESSSSQSDVPTSSQADKEQDSATGSAPSSTHDGSEQNPSTDDEQSSTPSSEQGSAPEDNQNQSSTPDSTTPPSGSDENDEQQPPDKNSPSLEFELSNDNSYYIVTGIGSCLSYFLDIPEEYEGKPVKEIAEGAFLENGNVYVVTIPKSVEAIHANAFCNDISVLFMHSYPLEGFIDGWIQNTDNCYWYSDEMPLAEDFYNGSYNYWYKDDHNVPMYWGVYTSDYLLTDNNKENIISVYTQYADIYLNQAVSDDYFDFEYDKIFIGAKPMYFTSPDSSLENFSELQVGDTFSDVLKSDPFIANYGWMFASWTEAPKVSTHFFKQAYYRIHYDDNLVITSIEKILPETN